MRLIGGFFRLVGGTIKWALIIGALLIVAGIIAAVLAFGHKVSNSDKGAAKRAAAYRTIELDASATAVKARLGKPDSTSSVDVAGSSETCWYYGFFSTKGEYQYCFSHGRLVAKNRDS